MITGLTPRQEYVLLVLANKPCACGDTEVWYPLRPSQVIGAVQRLVVRRLVEVAGSTRIDGREVRTYKPTPAGLNAISHLDKPTEEE